MDQGFSQTVLSTWASREAEQSPGGITPGNMYQKAVRQLSVCMALCVLFELKGSEIFDSIINVFDFAFRVVPYLGNNGLSNKVISRQASSSQS